MESTRKEAPVTPPRFARATDLVVRWLAPVATAVAFVAVLLSEHSRVEHDLQLVMPSEALPGRPVAMRAFIFVDLDDPKGPRFARERVKVRLVSKTGSVLARGSLLPSAAKDVEGTLAIPPSARGRFIVHAEAALGEGTIAKVQAPLTVSPSARPLEARGRLAHPLQQYTLFPMRLADTAMDPSHRNLDVEPRVSGGACVPDHRCDMLVYRSDPRVGVAVERTASVEPLDSDTEPSPNDARIVPLDVRVHGPEADAQLVASQGEQPLAHRTARLPVALGAPVLRVRDALLRAPANPSFEVEALEPGRPIIVDAFRDGFWERTGSVQLRNSDRGPATFELPFAPLDEGTWRVQVRTDPFSSASAATRMVHVRAPSKTDMDALRSTLASARLEERQRFGAMPPSAHEALSNVVAFILSLDELDLVPQPLAISGALQATWGVDDRKQSVRLFAIAVVLLCGVIVVSILLRKGLRAAAEARALMEQTDANTRSGRRVWAATAQVVGLVSVVGLVFLAVVMMMLARGGW